MTDDDRTLERAARSWLEVGPARAPDGAVAAALRRIETTPQERDLRILRRFTEMPMPARLAAAAVIGVLAVAGAVYLLAPGPRANVGVPGPTIAPFATPSVAPPTFAALSPRPAPATTFGDWQAISDGAIEGVVHAAEHIQLSIDWQDGLHAWIQTPVGDLVLRSASVEAPADEIRLQSTAEADARGCEAGQVGRYGWERSDDGLFLTLTTIEDACPARASVMSRTWVHSLSAVTDGGPGVIPFDSPKWIGAALPDQRFGLSGDGFVDLRSIEGPDRRLVVVRQPSGVDTPCSATRPTSSRQPITSADDFISFTGTLPGFTATDEQATVTGLPAVHVTLTPKGSAPCLEDGSIVAFSSAAPTGEIALAADQPQSLWYVTSPTARYLIVYEGASAAPDEEAAVIASLEFLDQLPAP